jgi:hypothetical protein
MKLTDRINCYARFHPEEISQKERAKDITKVLLIPGGLTLNLKRILDERYNLQGFKEKAACYFMSPLPESVVLDSAKLVGYYFLVKSAIDLLAK